MGLLCRYCISTPLPFHKKWKLVYFFISTTMAPMKSCLLKCPGRIVEVSRNLDHVIILLFIIYANELL